MASQEECELIMLILLRQRRRRRNKYKKRFWMKGILKTRKELGDYHRLIQEMRLNDHESFFQYFRMTPSRFDQLLGLVGPYLKKESLLREPISPAERLAVTLRFLATGDSQKSISFSFRLGHATVTKIVEETSEALWTSLQAFIKAPSSPSEWKKIAIDFWQLWNFPMCCGAIDGKHVVMQCPRCAGSSFFNYKGTHSIVLLAVCDARCLFTLIEIGSSGRNSDGGVFGESQFKRAMENGSLKLPPPASLPNKPREMCPYLFTADDAFPLKTWMMKPHPGKFLPEKHKIFNYRLSRARRVIENTFGITAARWRVLRRPIQASAKKVASITKAVCALHNYLMLEKFGIPSPSKRYCPAGFIDTEDRYGQNLPGGWRTMTQHDTGLLQIPRQGSNNYSRDAKSVQHL